MPYYDDGLRVREARARYFRDNQFGEDGGYGKAWVEVALGPVPVFVPNTAARVRAVRLHDLHHVATDYGTDLTGEAEIAAWEIASGCAGFAAAWVLNLYALAIGLVVARERTWRAFVRGRRTGNLYHLGWREGLLDDSVGALRSKLGLESADGSEPTARDRAGFAAWAGASIALALATLALLAAPLVLGARALLALL